MRLTLLASLTSFALAIASLSAEPLPVTTGLNSLPEIDFAKLSQRDLNPLGEKALAINAAQWKHAETEHFIYHFVHSYVATPISVEAEFHYRVVSKELEREQPPGDTKSHIYIFERPEDWQQFQTMGKLEPWTGGIQSRGSLFIQRDPSYKFSDNVLGHEIAHLIVHRFYSEGIPCWLNEGFAQYVSKGARSSFQRARGYLSRPRSQSVAAQDLIPLSTLTAALHPIPGRVDTFYDQSERLVRFLVTTDKRSFLALLDALGRHQHFDAAFLRIYGTRFSSISALEEQFRVYASKDAAAQSTGDG